MGILGILLSGVALGVAKQIERGRDAKRKADLQEISLGLSNFYDAKLEYPDELGECGEQWKINETVILDEMPCSPGMEEYRYIYDDSGSSDWFKLYAKLEYEQDQVIDELKCSQGCGPDCAYNYGVASSNVRIDSCGQEEELKYACAPGGSCEAYDDPLISECPEIYVNNPSCENECEERVNRCKNAKGKRTPD